ncbi:ATP-dependent DNA helicase PcrA [Polystyrenella longa]|uniref:DNA 3'-5' helicase n=1 Tax=Polystyrenella longa TaxID=2528007 RepID=A0A518CQJ3_9PLAN|nr:UvrD-helicase domain-containing protein [Polystyrenella longa]QDU81498.1 ATP-dependent DNA helicase PcrA [Polystyrenella longa]
MSAHLSSLNPPQRDAVLVKEGPLLVLAGAGTGKTRVITYRMAELIRQGVSPDQILSVTFTNKAAKEMGERTKVLLGGNLRVRPFISTFHSLCVRILRQEIENLGYPKTFAIYDRGDQESAARTALRDCRMADSTLRPGDLLNLISRWKMAGENPRTAPDLATNDKEFLAAVAFRRYQNNIKASGGVDFDDLLLLTVDLFKQFPEVLEKYQEKFQYVQIDEYQDTNGVQFNLIKSLVAKHNNLCVVGDDDQSIYGWRGAEVTHILNFQQHFPGATVVRLQDNYRCTVNIIDHANRLVKHNKGRHDKTLIAHKYGEDDVRIREYPSETDEAECVVREIEYLVNYKNVPAEDIAILFRTNEQPRPFETELRRRNIPYNLVGGQSFFDRREIRDVMSYLKIFLNQKDEVSLLRIINRPTRGISTATVEKLMKHAVAHKKPILGCAEEVAASDGLSKAAVAAVGQFDRLLKKYRERFASQPREMDRALTALLEEIDYNSEIEKQYKESQQQLMRKEVLDQIIAGMKEYQNRESEPSLAGFLDEVSLDGEDAFNEKEKVEAHKVTLMTLHSAKGLEFPRVYLIGLEEGLLPHKRSIDADNDAIQEERRLAYVGITRAKDYISISRAVTRAKYGKRSRTIPSRFLHEMLTDAAVEKMIEEAEEAEAE